MAQHYHRDTQGRFISCYHECRTLFSQPSFWVLTTFSFPLEHFIWEKLPPFCWLAQMLGL